MIKCAVLAIAAIAVPLQAVAAEDPAISEIRAELKSMKESYEARILALEQRLREAETRAAASPAPAAPGPVAAAANAFNPAVSVILGGSYANLSRDPAAYRIQGFMPAGEAIGPGKRGFNLGESELTLSANVDPHFSGRLTFSLGADNSLSVEEAHFETQGLGGGVALKGGRFLSAVGYLNSQHAHAWDFVDAPLAYQALFGGQHKPDGLQLRWLAPTERYLELGAEAGRDGAAADRNKNGIGAASVFAHLGDDLGDSASWRAGASYVQTDAAGRSYADLDRTGTAVTNAFDGNSRIWLLDGVFKWAPGGNASRSSFKLQGEYFRRRENGSLRYDTLSQSLRSVTLPYASAQSGWYLQSVYQFAPAWRAGLRYDQLRSGTPTIGLAGSALTTADFQRLSSFDPKRRSLMFDYSPTEFSRIRLQLAQDKSRPEATDKQLFLQYVMSLGAHGTHAF